MKRILILVVLVVFLAGCSGNGVIPPPIEEPPVEPPREIIEKFIGTWLNTNKNTLHITKIVIAESGDNLLIEEWGKCHPDDCYWGKQIVEKNKIINEKIEIVWDLQVVVTNQELVLENNKLKSTTLNHVLIPPGVVDDYERTDIFSKQK